jgi:hypothetical protein
MKNKQETIAFHFQNDPVYESHGATVDKLRAISQTVDTAGDRALQIGPDYVESVQKQVISSVNEVVKKE